MIDTLLSMLIVLAVLVAIVMIVRWAAPQLGAPPVVVNAILLVVGVIALVYIIRVLLGIGGVEIWPHPR